MKYTLDYEVTDVLISQESVSSVNAIDVYQMIKHTSYYTATLVYRL